MGSQPANSAKALRTGDGSSLPQPFTCSSATTAVLEGAGCGGDEVYVHQLMDRMQEEGFYLRRVNNGTPAKRADVYANTSVEWWSIVGQLIERRIIPIPNDEKLIARLTSRRKLYDSKGGEKLESKADLASRGVESPDRADALIGSIMLGIGSDPYALDPAAKEQMLKEIENISYYLERHRSPFHTPFIDFNRGW